MANREPIPPAEARPEIPGRQGRDHLYRSQADRSVAGVCGGLAERLGVDSALVRVPWLLSVPLTGGLTLLLYVLLAVAIPEEPAEEANVHRPPKDDWWQRARRSRMVTAALILLVAGLTLAFDSLGWLPIRISAVGRRLWSLTWPLSLVGLAVLLLAWVGRRRIPWQRLQQLGRSLPVRRSRRQRMAAGVCGGLAQRLSVDPLLVRLAWGVLTITVLGVVGALLYLAAALTIPAEE